MAGGSMSKQEVTKLVSSLLAKQENKIKAGDTATLKAAKKDTSDAGKAVDKALSAKIDALSRSILKLDCEFAHAAPVERAKSRARLVTHENVLGHRKLIKQHRFWMNGRDTIVRGRLRNGKAGWLAVTA